MQYFSILKCLTNHQKNLVTTAEPSNTSPQEKIIFKLERGNSKIIYWDLIKNKKETPTSEDKIRHKFNIEVSQVEWHQIYTVPVCTIEMKLQSFQFSINHFYYFSNDKLHRIGKSQTPNCSFCKTEVETISHLFLDSTKIQRLWNFFNHILTQINLYENVTNIIKLMGFYTKVSDKKYEIINHTLIVLKHFIHICRHKETQPTVAGFKARLLDTEYLEKQIAKNKNKETGHNEKWGQILNILTS